MSQLSKRIPWIDIYIMSFVFILGIKMTRILMFQTTILKILAHHSLTH